jgi:ribonucleoside-diphosphate reductase alpha chain
MFVTGGTWIHTTDGPRLVVALVGREFRALVDGAPSPVLPGFVAIPTEQPVVDLVTKQGYGLQLTRDQLVMTHGRGLVEAERLVTGDALRLHTHGDGSWDGDGYAGDGYLLGQLWGNGTLGDNKAVLSVWGTAEGTLEIRTCIQEQAALLKHRSDWKGFTPITGRSEWRLNSVPLSDLAARFGMTRGHKKINSLVESAESKFCDAFLRGAFDTDGHVEGNRSAGISVRLAQSDLEQLQSVQRMLARRGVLSAIYALRPGGERLMPDGRGSQALYMCKSSWRLSITGANAGRFVKEIGLAAPSKAAKWVRLQSQMTRGFFSKPPTATFVGMKPTTITTTVFALPNNRGFAIDANGLYLFG